MVCMYAVLVLISLFEWQIYTLDTCWCISYFHTSTQVQNTVDSCL